MPADDGYPSTRLGIDFGTSSTVAVVAVPGREPRPLLVDSTPLLPSAVCLDPDGRILTGRDALHAAAARPAAFEPHPKRRIDEGTLLLGRYYAENGTITSTTAKSNVTFTLRRNSKVNASGKANFFPEPAQYRCTGNTLKLYSAQGNYSNDLIRVSPS